jgi:anti-sigma factor RsiW
VRCSRFSSRLDEYVDCSLNALDRREIEEHVEWCSECATLLEELRVVDALLLSSRSPLEPAPNFTFRVMADVRGMPQPHVRRTPLLPVLATYLAFAWTAIGLWFTLGPASAHAAFNALRDGLLQYRDTFTALTDAVSQIFGRGVPGIAASMSLILSLDLVAALAAVGAALACLLAAPASAKTYTHGINVFMSSRTIGPDDVVDGDLNVVLGNVDCDGGTIHGSVRTIAGSFNDEGGCTIDGDLVPLLDNSALSAVAPWLGAGSDAIFKENERVLRHMAFGVLVLLAFLLFPVRVRVALSRVEKHPGISAVIGILALVAVVPVAILLVLSIIGIPLVALEFAALFAGWWIGQAAVSLLIGRRLFELVMPQTTPSALAALVLGLVVVTAAELVPIVGWAVTATVFVVGLGATILGFVGESAFTPTPLRGSPPPVGGTPMKTA